MEVALTFGSLGDIIALCQLAIQLGRAVGVGGVAARGESGKEYQKLRNDLDLFIAILTEVVATYQQHELSPHLQGLDRVSQSVVEKCTTLIQDMLGHLTSRYGSCLSVQGSGWMMRDAYKRVEWCVREKERIQNLRNGLQEGVQTLSLLTSLAIRKSARVDNATLLARIDEVQRICGQAHQEQRDILKLLKKQRAETISQAEQQMQKLGHVQDQDTFRAITEVKGHLQSVSQVIVDIQIAASSAMLMRPLDSTRGLPVILEDALGRSLEIPAQWIDTLEWNVLNGLLIGKFKGLKGEDMVSRNEYALEESATGKDLNTGVPLHRCLRRGMRVYMSMIFYDAEVVAGACPRCHAETDAPEGVSIQCPVSDCGMSFRLEKQVVESLPPQAMPHSIPAEGLTPAPPKVVSETRSTEAEFSEPPSAGSNQYTSAQSPELDEKGRGAEYTAAAAAVPITTKARYASDLFDSKLRSAHSVTEDDYQCRTPAGFVGYTLRPWDGDVYSTRTHTDGDVYSTHTHTDDVSYSTFIRTGGGSLHIGKSIPRHTYG
ncbi:hypothetical protein LMH87_001704 [Akanthomyces muscarius]|uniref:Ubiquitin-like domain-containing protein n=1 Tax=Akanthomyces muscarius TaxID=2231603 RepID=A0A9W8UIP9_AKAMU|nr:hypothetical protein LMH87_001704 [Akanthomyces muscarius]KAJ4147159.1 hypothetical protein LMH87_001704 [Akanthomyces muscarius]